MGLRFRIEHANLIAYLTFKREPFSNPVPAPRIGLQSLAEFFEGLIEVLVAPETERLISSRPDWRQAIRSIANEGLNRLHVLSFEASRGDPDRLLDSERVARLLDPLRPYLSSYSVFILILPGTKFSYPLDEFFRSAALATADQALVMKPDEAGLINILDPFPALRTLARAPVEPPCIVFWTPKGDAVATDFYTGQSFFERTLLPLLRQNPERVNDLIELEAFRADLLKQSYRLLHLSDLHFGGESAARTRRYLKSHLRLVARDTHRVIVTGDLFDSPSQALSDEFREFRADIERDLRKPLMLIPGNHDVRSKGNAIGRIGKRYDFVADIGWQPIVVDDQIRCVFLCFNSAEGGSFARGWVSPSQLKTVAAALNEELAGRLERFEADIREYRLIALVHHHPFAYETAPTTRYDTWLRFITGDEDSLTRFKEAKAFISWCAEKGVKLILHGHKHVPHHVEARINGEERDYSIRAIGCGSTTGAGRTPLCYDTISLDREGWRCGVTFYQDASGSGAGFRVQQVTIDTRTEPMAW